MPIDVELLAAGGEDAWTAFTGTHPAGLIYYSLPYRDFLNAVVGVTETVYLMARRGGAVVGVLPLAVADGPHGPVVNALPFYGSNGGPLVQPGDGADAIRAALVEAAEAACLERRAAALTLVDNPLDPSAAVIEARLKPTLTDERIGQFTPLPAAGPGLRDALLEAMHQKTRNMVRKALKAGFDIVRCDDDDAAWHALVALHHENMEAIGGRAKPCEVFTALRRTLPPGAVSRLHVARRDGRVAAALLTLHHNGIVEYFTPVIRQQDRSDQPLSALILLGMEAAAGEGARWWNWGATWLTQEGVHRFKSRWGTRDIPYRYFTRIWNDALLECAPADLLAAYPYVYVAPFSALRTP